MSGTSLTIALLNYLKKSTALLRRDLFNNKNFIFTNIDIIILNEVDLNQTYFTVFNHMIKIWVYVCAFTQKLKEKYHKREIIDLKGVRTQEKEAYKIEKV